MVISVTLARWLSACENESVMKYLKLFASFTSNLDWCNHVRKQAITLHQLDCFLTYSGFLSQVHSNVTLFMRSWNLYRLKRALCRHAHKNSWLCSDRGRGFNDRTFASPTAGCCVAQSSRAGPKTPLLVVCWTTLSHVYALGLAHNKAILALRLLTPTRNHLPLCTPVPLNRPTMILKAFFYVEIISIGFCNNWFQLNGVASSLS